MTASEWAKCDEPQSLETWKHRQRAILADLEAAESMLFNVQQALITEIMARQKAVADRDTWCNGFNKVEAERDALKARLAKMQKALEDAPRGHEIFCGVVFGKSCNCWQAVRSAALAEVGASGKGCGCYQVSNEEYHCCPRHGGVPISPERKSSVEDMSGPDGPVADSSDGYKILQCEHEGDAKEESDE